MFIIYLLLFLISSGGIYFLGRNYFIEARRFSLEELKARLEYSGSVRQDIYENFLAPFLKHLKIVYLLAFWRFCEKMVTRARIIVLKLETRLKWLADNIHGKHINLDVSKKSEYWENLNGTKPARNAAHSAAGGNGNGSKTR